MTSQLYNLCLQNSGAAESRTAAAGANTPELLLHIFLSPLPPLLPASRDTPVCSSSSNRLFPFFALFSLSLVFLSASVQGWCGVVRQSFSIASFFRSSV